ncbi:MAG TPA: hypothetical protein VGX28_06985 [Frankiaceae bacterium]|jgi:hypothetical protein|nr:hypothetical protein [Frankiaceae bacterium]
MALRDKLTERVQPYLEPGEQVRWVFPAVGGPSPWLMALAGSLLYLILTKPKIVVITDRRILVLKGNKATQSKPKGVELSGPHVALGPLKGMWAPIQLGNKLYVHRRFHKDVNEYDEAFRRGQLGGTGAAS